MNSPSVSIVLPCHGFLPYLRETVESVLCQSFHNFELLLVRDRIATSDLGLVNNIVKMDNRIRALDSSGAGISHALNSGIKEARSSLIARIDADDMMDPQRIEHQFREISSQSSVLCVGSQLRIINEIGEFLRYTNFPTSPKRIRKMMMLRNVVAHPSVIFRKESVLKVGLYRAFFDGSEDYDLWLRLLRDGEIINLPEPLTTYRVHEDQQTRKNRELQQEMDAFTRFSSYSGIEGLFLSDISTLKEFADSRSKSTNKLIRDSRLSEKIKRDLVSSNKINNAVSSPKLRNLLALISVFVTSPSVFYLAIQYSFSRINNVRK